MASDAKFQPNKINHVKQFKLFKQFNELKIDSEMKLANSIELIFEKVSIVVFKVA